jgi:dethiobiotin synthetase
MQKSIFVAGIGTDIGKSVASAILCTALSFDYWKPIQSGNLEFTDSDFLSSLCPALKTHPEAYRLSAPLSPHAAAEIDTITISLDHIRLPDTSRGLVIEGAGGLMVPLNKRPW